LDKYGLNCPIEWTIVDRSGTDLVWYRLNGAIYPKFIPNISQIEGVWDKIRAYKEVWGDG
jgi:hypothetical protein